MKEKIIKLIEDVLKVPVGTITEDTMIEDVEQWDSLAHVMIIGQLEEELGVELFERKGRNIRLTKYGELFLPYVKQSITSLETGVKTLKDYIDPNAGTIVLAGFQSVAQFATDLMVRYQSETNRLGVQFQYSQEGWGSICDKIFNGSADLILATKIEDPRIEGTQIGIHRLAVLVYEDHRLADRESVDLRELDGEKFISFDRKGELITNLWKIFNVLHVKPNVVTETPNDLIIYGLVAAGRGVAVVPYPLGGAPTVRRSSRSPIRLQNENSIFSGIKNAIFRLPQNTSEIM